ncbi:hypothetical protein ACROYT_G041001, partial [Oculina patagonica]
APFTWKEDDPSASIILEGSFGLHAKMGLLGSAFHLVYMQNLAERFQYFLVLTQYFFTSVGGSLTLSVPNSTGNLKARRRWTSVYNSFRSASKSTALKSHTVL